MKAEATKGQKARKERLSDRITGIVLITAGCAGVIVGMNSGHIPMAWPIVGLAGIALLADSFLTKKPVKIAFNALVILILAALYFTVKEYNSADGKADTEPNGTTTEQIDE